MMNDRFSAELRQHLLATADERPADGRLAAIIDGVAVTAQRHPIMAGLTWVPRRTGVFPSAAVRYGLLAAALLIALVAAASQGEVSLTAALLKLGADPDARGQQRRTALMRAAASGHREVVELLLGAGASSELRDENGETALSLARERGHTDVASVLEKR